MSIDARRSSPAALRNRHPILDVLTTVLPATGTVLEIASGSGEHIVHFAKAWPGLVWQPSDPSAQARASIAAWVREEALYNVLAPVEIDSAADAWPINRAEAVISINMVHIAPWAATLGLLRNAAHLLPGGAPLFVYGPFRRLGEAMASSNAAFDQDLRSRDPAWGIRLLEDVEREAEQTGFRLDRVVPMPANNLSVVWRKK